MQIGALSSAMIGMRRASFLMDSAAAQVATDGPASVVLKSSSPAAPLPSDTLMTAVPNLIIAGELFKSNAFVARVAQDSYQAALNLYHPAT